jgi:N-acetylmuramoyl-L-alanine amidase
LKSKLRVIAGHGGADPGAVSGEITERELNIAAVLSFNDALSRDYDVPPGALTIITYPESTRDGKAILEEKIAQANAAGADQVLIEVHHNVAAAGSDTQLWYSQNAAKTAGDETWLVLPDLAREIGFLLGRPVPQLSSDRSRFGKLGILDDTVCTAVLVEARNVDLLATPEWEYSFGVALAKACAKIMGWPQYARPAVPPPPVVDVAAAAKLTTAKQLVADLAATVAAL